MHNPFTFYAYSSFARRLFAVAGNTLLVYDYLLTLPLEVRFCSVIVIEQLV